MDRVTATHLFSTDAEGTRHELSDRTAIEKACIAENQQRFTQAYGPDFTQSPLEDDVGILGDGWASKEILEGTYDMPSSLDKYTKMLINALRMPTQVKDLPPMSSTITPEENKAAWKKQKERTASEPDGLHFGHYKAAAQDPFLSNIDAIIRSLPYKHGFAPKLWQQITDVVIPKKAGVLDVELMRTIQLMHSEANMNNKKLGKEVMANAEKAGVMVAEQYGSRKQKRAIVAALDKRLTLDLCRSRRLACGYCVNDAKSCYDRILHAVASIALQRLGCPPMAVRSMLHTLQRAPHRIKSAYGLSKEFYGAEERPLQGIGQGNGAGPTIWAAISVPLIEMLKISGYGVEMASALSQEVTSLSCYAFVDDCDVIQVAKSTATSGTEVADQIQAAMNTWDGGLRATGGALVPRKSFWYLLDFKWEKNLWSAKTKAEMEDVELTILDPAGTVSALEQLETADARETLGIYLSLDGDDSVQAVQLRNKTEVFADCLRTGYISRADAWYCLHASFMKTLEYPMEVCCLNKKQWDHIMAPLLLANLPRSGIVRSFPRQVVYGPKKYHGLGLRHPWVVQTIRHFQVLWTEWHKPSMTGKLLRSNMEQLRMEVGWPGQSAQWPLADLQKYLSKTWLSRTLIDGLTVGLTFQDDAPELLPLRVGDVFLMQRFWEMGFRRKQLFILNTVRMSMKVTTLADIATLDGSAISDLAFNGHLDSRPNPYSGWPRDPPEIIPEHWHLWKWALAKSFLGIMEHQEVDDGMAKRLPEPLGPWNQWFVHHHWTWYYDNAAKILYHREGAFYGQYHRGNMGRTRQQQALFERTLTEEGTPVLQAQLPPNLMLADIRRTQSGKVGIFDTAPSAFIPSSMMYPFDRQHELPTGRHWPISRIEAPNGMDAVATSLRAGNAVAVTDGSFKTGCSTSGGVLFAANFDRQSRISCINQVPGPIPDQDAYRAELGGIVGMLETLKRICHDYAITEGHLTIGLDGSQALKDASEVTWHPPASKAHYDLIRQIRSRLHSLPLRISWRWVEGHQDDKSHKLDAWAKANVMADALAQGFRRHLQRHGQDVPPEVYILPAHVQFRQQPLTSINESQLYEAIQGPDMILYWQRKRNIPPTSQVAWECSGEALRKLPFHKLRRTVKQATGIKGVGAMLAKWYPGTDSSCPRCEALVEDAVHVVACPDERAEKVWAAALDDLDIWMQDNQTAPSIRQAILEGLRSWKEGRADHPSIPAARAQSRIGWYNLLIGFASPHWGDTQELYFRQTQVVKTGKEWLTALIRKLWETAWDMWEHRNGIKHSPDFATEESLWDLQDNIRYYFELGAHVLPAMDRHHLSSTTVHQVLRQSIADQRRWLATVKAAHQLAEQRAVTPELQPLRELMLRWLQP